LDKQRTRISTQNYKREEEGNIYFRKELAMVLLCFIVQMGTGRDHRVIVVVFVFGWCDNKSARLC
jgi:hypothetical protein